MPRKGENIYKRKDGRWEGRYLECYKADGKAKYRSVYASSYTEVKAKLKSFKRSNAPPKVRSYCVAKYTAEWLNTVKLDRKESTYCKYRNVCKKHILPYFGGMNIGLISHETVERFLEQKLKTEKLSSRTVNGILCVIKLIFAYAQANGADTICNFRTIHVRQTKKEIRILTLDEQKAFSEYLLSDMSLYKLGVYLSLYTGIRIGELSALKWGNIDTANGIMKIDKTMQRVQTYEEGAKTKVVIAEPKSQCSHREIPLPEFLCALLKDFKVSDSCFLLSGSSNKYVEPRAMSYQFKKCIRECGLKDVNFHAMRHTFATRCVERNFDIKTLSEILGHSSVKITLDRYVHSSMELKRKNMEKLSGMFE